LTDAKKFSIPLAGGNHYVVFAETARSLERQLSEEKRAREEAEAIRLAAISTASLQNTRASAKERIGPDNPYYTTAYGDVCVAIDREIAERERAESAEQRVESLEAALRELVNANDAYAKATLTMATALANFTDRGPEERAHMKAISRLSNAEKAARAALSVSKTGEQK
jgi:hypothetical protein